ncbi:MAG: asparagine synthase (glutamine-hydrolyzing) [Planctomycetota bacterium]
MCGIAGLIRCGDVDTVQRMTRLMAHRGPDDSGHWSSGDVVLGHRRLSILDPTPQGHQPMSGPDGEVVIVFNGEIYNHLRLREELAKKGHRFRTGTDTETLLACWRQWGVGMLSKLDGIFAFGLWDDRNGTLLLARDATGVKPLFYRTTPDGGLAFASELKALRLVPGVEDKANRRAIRSALRFACNMEDESMLASVWKLPPGQRLVWQDGRIERAAYWRHPEPNPRRGADPDQLAKELRSILSKTVEDQMLSDVPLGAALSGGLDSSGITALMAGSEAARDGATVSTFTVGHGEDDPDLLKARVVAEHCKTDHHEILVASGEVQDLLPKTLWFMEEPLGQMESVQMFLNYQAAAQHVKVLLIGEGADELFAGYDRFRLFDKNQRMTPGMRRALYERVFMYAERQPKHALAGPLARLKLGQLPGSPMADPHPRFPELDLRGLPREQMLEKALHFESSTYLHQLSLKRADATGMAHSLELRVPFLAKAVVEFAMQAPGDLQRRHGVEKWLLREALRPVLPTEIVERRKRPFQMQLDQGLVDTLDALGDRLLRPEDVRARGFFEPERVDALRRGRPSHGAPLIAHKVWSYRVWAMLMCELWARLFLDRDPEALAPESLSEVA